MRFSNDTEIKHIHTGLLNRQLPKAEWTHAAHFAAAISLLRDPNEDPFKTLPEIIRNYNLATGVENTDTSGYHHTITLVSLLAASHVLEISPKQLATFEITNRLLESEYGNSKWVLDYWSKVVLFSAEARQAWVAPDIKPLPFSVSQI